jgi:peptidoglycan/xylan/chitin deacetylase (PgdA/CDA1 family)
MTQLAALMYHRIDRAPPGVAHAGNYTSPSLFVAQLDAVLGAGYQPITLGDWWAFRETGAAVPERSFIVTFDDGYSCFVDNAWPTLRERGITPIIFLVASEIGGTNRWDPDDPPAQLLDADRIRALRAEGVEFGSHGDTHVPLARVPLDAARTELARSKEKLATVVGAPIHYLGYPYSNQSRAVRGLARDAGYRLALRGGGGLNTPRTNPHGLRRMLMSAAMTPDRLTHELERRIWW